MPVSSNSLVFAAKILLRGRALKLTWTCIGPLVQPPTLNFLSRVFHIQQRNIRKADGYRKLCIKSSCWMGILNVHGTLLLNAREHVSPYHRLHVTAASDAEFDGDSPHISVCESRGSRAQIFFAHAFICRIRVSSAVQHSPLLIQLNREATFIAV